MADIRLPGHSKLDNPVWHSLSEVHKDLALNYGTIKFYPPVYCPFGGFQDENTVSEQLGEYAQLAENFFIVGEKPPYSGRLFLQNELVCLQMVIEKKIESFSDETGIQLNGKHEDALFDLVNRVQPGYFKRKTAMMGDYFGIFKENKLVAATGERMKMNGFTEVSAVVTHPAYTGNGYASRLIAFTVNKIFDENKVPCLHVAETNMAAIRLYERLGFKTRRKISFWNFVKRKNND